MPPKENIGTKGCVLSFISCCWRMQEDQEVHRWSRAHGLGTPQGWERKGQRKKTQASQSFEGGWNKASDHTPGTESVALHQHTSD
eukprot:5046728-Amphidinium_carterae.3